MPVEPRDLSYMKLKDKNGRNYNEFNKFWDRQELDKFEDVIPRLKSKDPTLTKLDLWDHTIGPEGAIELAEAFKGNDTCEWFRLRMSKIGPEGMKAIAESFKGNTKCTEINLYRNSIGDEGAEALAEGLKGNTTIKEITLSDNGIGPVGVRALSATLVNSKVRWLNLWMNRFGNEGALALADYLKANEWLTHLHIGRCDVGTKGARALWDVIKVKTKEHFDTVDLYENVIGADLKKEMKPFFKDHRINKFKGEPGDEEPRGPFDPPSEWTPGNPDKE